jgi:hypothetical protein
LLLAAASAAVFEEVDLNKRASAGRVCCWLASLVVIVDDDTMIDDIGSTDCKVVDEEDNEIETSSRETLNVVSLTKVVGVDCFWEPLVLFRLPPVASDVVVKGSTSFVPVIPLPDPTVDALLLLLFRRLREDVDGWGSIIIEWWSIATDTIAADEESTSEVFKAKTVEEEEDEAFLFFDAVSLNSCSSSSLSDTGNAGWSSISATPIGSVTDKIAVFAPLFLLPRGLMDALLLLKAVAEALADDPVFICVLVGNWNAGRKEALDLLIVVIGGTVSIMAADNDDDDGGGGGGGADEAEV